MRNVWLEDRKKQLKVRMWLSFSVALVFFVFCIVFFKFPDNSMENFVFRIDENGDAIVMGYTGDASTLEIPSEYEGHKVRYISESAFAGFSSSVKKVIIPSSVREIGDDAFADCSQLKTVVLSEGLRTIGYGAFRNCSSLKKITLPESLEKIDDYEKKAEIDNKIVGNDSKEKEEQEAMPLMFEEIKNENIEQLMKDNPIKKVKEIPSLDTPQKNDDEWEITFEVRDN